MINDLKDLKALFKLCRAQGVTEIKLSGVEISFGSLPDVPQGTIQESPELEDVPSDENILFWSTPQGQEILDKKTGVSS